MFHTEAMKYTSADFFQLPLLFYKLLRLFPHLLIAIVEIRKTRNEHNGETPYLCQFRDGGRAARLRGRGREAEER